MLKVTDIGIYILSVKLEETLTLALFQQDNESVDINEPEHKSEVEKWAAYLQV